MNNQIIRIGQVDIRFLLESTDTNGALAMLTDGVDPNVNRSVARSGSGFNERANSESGSEQTTKWVLSNADLVT